MIESRPGNAPVITMGNNYAQPSVSYGSIYEGNGLSRSVSWMGDRNCGAPVERATPDQHSQSLDWVKGNPALDQLRRVCELEKGLSAQDMQIWVQGFALAID